jgi:magnesium-transporting ATPase (P-type)
LHLIRLVWWFLLNRLGTMTKEGLQFRGVHQIDGRTGQFSSSIVSGFPEFSPTIRQAMEVSHSLQLVGTDFVGNFVDIEMFRATGARLDIGADTISRIYAAESEAPKVILKRYEFVHAHAYMSVITRNEAQGSVDVFLKGSFERIKDLVKPGSIPADFDTQASRHALEGYYVLALAHKTFENVSEEQTVLEMERGELERDCMFIGFMLFRNELKSDTGDALSQLKGGGCRVVMITGDNANTAYGFTC